MLLRTDSETVALTLHQARGLQMIDEADTAVIFIDLDVLDNRLDHLKRVFPSSCLHAPAIKAHPLLHTLSHISKQHFGLEAASIEEVAIALAAGVPGKKIIFDSPVKTAQEIKWCAENAPGLTVNANSFDELERIPSDGALRTGLRINPLVDAGSPEVFQVSGRHSKFGIPISDREKIIRVCLERPDIRGLHLHVGSEVSKREIQAMAVRDVYRLALEIDGCRNEAGLTQKLEYIDIGGGFPAKYSHGNQPGLEEYIDLLSQHAAGMFDRYQVITEFGRFVFAHCAWLWSQVEYLFNPTGDTPGRAMLHAGADLFVREIYMDNPPCHQYEAIGISGKPKTSPLAAYDLAGPLCFGGDFLGHGVMLPALEKGDQLIIRDIGANSFALWSRHCSRRFPKVIAYSSHTGTIEVARPRETLDDIIAFWKGPKIY